MSVIGSNVLAGASGSAGAAGYEIERSLRFNEDDSAYLSKDFASAGNRKTWTWSGWVKISEPGSFNRFFTAGNGTTDSTFLGFLIRNNDVFTLEGGSTIYRRTSSVFRDVSAWYHLVVAFDTTQATGDDRIKIYINGVQLTDFATSNNPSPNSDHPINNNVVHDIGANHYGGGLNFNSDFYLADVHFIDGQALAPTDFGEFDADTGVWNPKEYSGSYGTNGFHLPFSDNSSNAALGDDSSGNNNDWTPINLSASTSDTTYTPTSNTNLYGMTWDQIFNAGNTAGVYSLDNTTATGTLAVPKAYTSSVEVLVCSTNASAPVYVNGVSVPGLPSGNNINNAGWRTALTGSGTLTSVAVQSNGGQRGILFQIRVDGVLLVNTNASECDSLVDSPTNGTQTDTGVGNEVVGNYCTLNPLANGGLTLTNGNLDISRATASWKNSRGTFGVTSGKWYWEFLCTGAANSTNGPKVGYVVSSATLDDPGGDAYGWAYLGYNATKWNSGVQTSYGATWGNGDVIGVAFDADAGNLTFYKNGVSQGTAFTGLTSGPYFPVAGIYGTSSGVLNFGQRPFAYTAPSGFNAINTASLSDPTIADGSTAMDVALYTGNGSTQTISGLNFSPDLVWMKVRSYIHAHQLYDTIRGTNKALYSNLTDSEFTDTDALTAFNSDGFTLGAEAGINESTRTYVAWAWDGGTSTVSNTDGSITSSVRANASAGFSIVSYTGNGSNATVGHGLGVAPAMIMFKKRSATQNWVVYHSAMGATKALYLDQTVAAVTSSNFFQDTQPTSSVFSLGTGDGVNTISQTFIAYCFAPVEGYSAFGSYTGNGSADGPFVYTGFRPRWLMTKRTDSSASGDWNLVDTARGTYNVVGPYLYANQSAAEGTAPIYDILSNGFKIRESGAGTNASGSTYIYAAFAENPFSLNGGLAR